MAHQPSEYCDCTECLLRKALERETAEKERIKGELTSARDALRRMLAVYEELMPGVRHISVKNYAELNEAPIAARRALSFQEPPKLTKEEADALVKRMRADPELDAHLRKTFTSPDTDPKRY
jgi:hypothetical protein